MLDRRGAAPRRRVPRARQCGEFAHLHPGYDGSLHLALPPALAADRSPRAGRVAHPLAGVRLTPGMVMCYGPRDADELDVVARASSRPATPTPAARSKLLRTRPTLGNGCVRPPTCCAPPGWSAVGAGADQVREATQLADPASLRREVEVDGEVEHLGTGAGPAHPVRAGTAPGRAPRTERFSSFTVPLDVKVHPVFSTCAGPTKRFMQAVAAALGINAVVAPSALA